MKMKRTDEMEFTIDLKHNSKKAMYIQLYDYIKNEIIVEQLKANEPIPSVRKLALHLGISRNTVETAYQQLLAEGYIYSQPQKGYFVCVSDYGNLPRNKTIKNYAKTKQIPIEYQVDFKNDFVEEENFDFQIWRKHLNTIIQNNRKQLLTYGMTQGEEPLRKAISKYVHRSRGVNAEPENMFIGAGIQPLLSILCSIFKRMGIDTVAVQDPGFNRAKSVFSQNNFQMEPLSTIEGDIDFESLEKNNKKLLYLSPSHQFPTGSVMRIEPRNRIIHWADEKDGYIIEDDYNSELRYEGKPIPAMQGMDYSKRVIYLGSFSAVLVPAIRISFMILPDELLKLYQLSQFDYTQTASKLEQLALANMIETGNFEKHIRKIRKKYAEKSDSIIKLLRLRLGEQITIVGVNPGLNILIQINIEIDEERIIQELKQKGINIAGIQEYSLKKEAQKYPILVLTFRGTIMSQIETGIIAMKSVFSQHNQCID